MSFPDARAQKMQKTQVENRIDFEFMGDEAFENLYRIVHPWGYLAALRRLGRDEDAERFEAYLAWRGEWP